MIIIDLLNYIQSFTSYYYFLDFYSSIIVLCSLSFHLCIVNCWPVCLHLSDQILLILNFFLGCDWNFSVGRIQTGRRNWLPPQVCGRSWRCFQLGGDTFLIKLIALIDLKYPASYSFKPYFVDFDLCVSYLLYQSSLILKLVFVCELNVSVEGIQTGHMDLLSLQACVRSWRGCCF